MAKLQCRKERDIEIVNSKERESLPVLK